MLNTPRPSRVGLLPWRVVPARPSSYTSNPGVTGCCFSWALARLCPRPLEIATFPPGIGSSGLVDVTISADRTVPPGSLMQDGDVNLFHPNTLIAFFVLVLHEAELVPVVLRLPEKDAKFRGTLPVAQPFSGCCLTHPPVEHALGIAPSVGAIQGHLSAFRLCRVRRL